MSIQDIKTFMESDVGLLVCFISLISWCISAPFIIVKRYKQGKKLLQNEKARGVIRDVVIHIIFITFGIIVPLLTMISTWHLSFSILWLLLQVLSIYAIFSYIGLMYIFAKILSILKKHGI